MRTLHPPTIHPFSLQLPFPKRALHPRRGQVGTPRHPTVAQDLPVVQLALIRKLYQVELEFLEESQCGAALVSASCGVGGAGLATNT